MGTLIIFLITPWPFIPPQSLITVNLRNFTNLFCNTLFGRCLPRVCFFRKKEIMYPIDNHVWLWKYLLIFYASRRSERT